MKTCKDWFGVASVHEPKMSLEIKGDKLFFEFRAEKKPTYDRAHRQGDFFYGLWEQDVAEFFVAGAGARYQEINISPSGAWWSGLFSDYRVLESNQQFDCSIESKISSHSWEISFEAELRHFQPWRELPSSERRISVASILYDPDPQYFAWNHGGGGEPDFHRQDLFKVIDALSQ